jgi:hypothetical protein
MITKLDQIAYNKYHNNEIKNHYNQIKEHNLTGCSCGFYTIEDFIKLNSDYIDKKSFYKNAKQELRLMKLKKLLC